LKHSGLEFEKADRILSGGLLSSKEPGEFEGELKLTGKGFETVDDVLRDLAIAVLELRQRWFGGSTNLASGPAVVLIFAVASSSSFLVLLRKDLSRFFLDLGCIESDNRLQGLDVVTRLLLFINGSLLGVILKLGRWTGRETGRG